MKIFFGSAIQGAQDREARAKVYRQIIDIIKSCGFELFTEHATSNSYQEAMAIWQEKIGSLPKSELDRRIVIRNQVISWLEGDEIGAAIFEVSVPSLGTGIELTHACLRSKSGLKAIPILALYQKDFWPNKLSTMIQGITPEKVPGFQLKEYQDINQAEGNIKEFLNQVS